MLYACYRLWDRATNSEVKKIELPQNPASIELSKDGKTFIIPHGHTVSFWDVEK